MTQDEILSALQALLPAQFNAIVLRLGIPPEMLSGSQTPQVTRAIEVIRFLENGSRLQAIVPLLRAVVAPLQPPLWLPPHPQVVPLSAATTATRAQITRGEKVDSGLELGHPFVTKIALFNMLGFAVATGIPTYIDPRMKHHKMYDFRMPYPLGYWVVLFALPLFPATWTWLSRSVTTSRLWAHFVLFGLAMASVHWNFQGTIRPEGLKSNILFWSVLYSVTSSITTALRCYSGHFPRKLRQQIAIRMLLFSPLMLVAWGFWLYFVWEPRVTDDVTEQVELVRTDMLQVVTWMAYLFAGPGWELWTESKIVERTLRAGAASDHGWS